MEKFEKLDNEHKELVKYWFEKYRKGYDSFNKFIEKHLTPEPVIEVGFWWKFEGVNDFDCSKLLIFVTGFNNNGKPKGYGFDIDGKWIEDDENYWCVYDLKPIKATPEEVEQRLIEEAKKIGYKPGMAIESLFSMSNNKISTHAEYVYTHKDNDIVYGGVWIYKNGKWAEIIDEKTEIRESVARLEAELQELKSKL